MAPPSLPQGPAAPARKSQRISELDGLRAVAIIMVAAYHYFSRFPEYLPYGKTFDVAGRHGALGVSLFFMISGFVITFTLSRSQNAAAFLQHRFFRLWPPLLACALITYAVMHLLQTPFTQARATGLSGFLPTLTFIDPDIWRFVLEVDDYIDGAYWSLFVEVRFYVWALLLTLVLGVRRLAPTLAISAIVLTPLWHGTSGMARLGLDGLFFVPFLPLFAAGALAFEAFEGRMRSRSFLAMAVMWALAMTFLDGAAPRVITTAFFVVFALLILRRTWLRPLAWGPLTGLGAVSYAFYLLHQNIGVGLLSLMPQGMKPWMYLPAVTGVFLIITGVSWAVFKLVERPSQRLARRLDPK